MTNVCKGRLNLAWATCIHDQQVHSMGIRRSL
jgi:hypothetical protein